MNVGVILAAGASERFQSVMHKQYLKLNGKEVIFYSIDAMRHAKCFDAIIAVVDEDEYQKGYIANKYNVQCIAGGNHRNESIKRALEFIKQNYPDTEKVVFHDGSRPMVNERNFIKFVEMLNEYDGVAISSNITDSLTTQNGTFADRREYLLIKTPEAFRFDVIYSVFDDKKSDTAIINQLPPTAKKHLYHSNVFDIKLTYPEDLFLAEQLMRINYFHTNQNSSTNYDLGNVLLLGGSGGVGQAICRAFDEHGVHYFAPTHKELDLLYLTVKSVQDACPFEPDVIINVAAAYADDSVGLIETFDKIFDVNLKSNLVLIEYAKLLNKKVHIIVMSSSSSTKGRENITNYSAAKAALNSIVESQGRILAENGILINAIVPEKIDTPMIEKLHKTNINKRELLGVEEVIEAVFEYASKDVGGKLVHIRKGL